MKLTTALGLTQAKKSVILTGKPEITGILSSDGEPYYVVRLKEETTVRCSVDPEILAYETDEVYIRESALNFDGWEFEDEKDPEKGFWMKDWVVDFSKGQEVPIYQETTIREWTKGNRKERTLDRKGSINDKIRKRMAEKRK